MFEGISKKISNYFEGVEEKRTAEAVQALIDAGEAHTTEEALALLHEIDTQQINEIIAADQAVKSSTIL